MLLDRVDRMTPGQILADTEIADFIAQMGIGIARAQRKLDRNSIKMLVKLAKTSLDTELSDGITVDGTTATTGKSLLSLGLVPAFYHFQEAELEVSLNVTMTVDRTTVVTLDTGFEYGDANKKGEATIEVKQAPAKRAEAVVTLRNNVDATNVRVQDNNEGGEDDTVEVPATGGLRGATLGETATNLARALEDLSTVHEAKVTILPGNGTLSIVETLDAVEVDGNDITILSKPAQPAVAYAQQTGIDPGEATFTWTDPIGGTPADHTFEFVATAGSAASGNAEVLIGAGSVETLEALVTAVNDAGAPGNGDYSATFLVQANKFVHHPRPAGHATLLDPAVTNPPKTPLLVRFLTNSTDVDDVADNDDHIDEVARFLLANPTIKVHVNGYTDIVGESSGFDNDKLSLDRAKAVIEELEDRGVPASQIHKPPKGFGATQFLCPHLPGDSSTVKGQKNAWNRRVEFVLDRSDTHPIMKLQADTAGPNRIEADDVSDLKPLGHDDGHGIIELNTGDVINIDAQTFTVGTDFNRGATPTESAENLADAINGRTYATAAEELSASFSGPTVTVGGEGTVAQIDLTSFLFGTPANDVEVTSTGAARATGFSGGTGAKAPGPGTTVTVGGKVLRLVVDPDDALEAREFRLGPDADATASELARVISTLPKTNATVEDNLITVEAPLGTTFATTDPKVFDLSDKRIGGAAKVKEEEKNQAFAMHANISVTDSRRFGLVVTGTSKITAKLVSLPAPVELLNEVKEFLAEEE